MSYTRKESKILMDFHRKYGKSQSNICPECGASEISHTEYVCSSCFHAALIEDQEKPVVAVKRKKDDQKAP